LPLAHHSLFTTTHSVLSPACVYAIPASFCALDTIRPLEVLLPVMG